MASGFTPPSERSRSNRGDPHSDPDLGSRPLVPAAATIMVQRPGTSSSSRAVVRTFTSQRTSIVMLVPQPLLVMVPAVRLNTFRLLKPRSWRVLPSLMRIMRLGLHCKLRKQHRTASRGKGVFLKKRPCSATRCAKKRGKLWMQPVRLYRRRSNLSKPQGLKHGAQCRRCARLPWQRCPKRSNPNKSSES